MNYLAFRELVVAEANRDDVTPSSPHVHWWIREARRFVQNKVDFKDMEEVFEVPLFLGMANVSKPPLFKKDRVTRIINSSGDALIIMVKENNRATFRRLVAITPAYAWYESYKGSLIILDDHVSLEGYPLIYSLWRDKVDLFPKVGPDCDGKIFSMDHYVYRQFDLSGLPPGSGVNQIDGFEDFLLDEYANLLFYRTMIEANPWLRQAEKLAEWEGLYKEAVGQAIVAETDKDQEGTPTPYMGGNA